MAGAKQTGRPPRRSEIVDVRGRLPDNHPLIPYVRGMSPAEAATFLFQICSLMLRGLVVPSGTVGGESAIPAGLSLPNPPDSAAFAIDNNEMAAIFDFGRADDAHF